jgi:hypothetical protein
MRNDLRSILPLRQGVRDIQAVNLHLSNPDQPKAMHPLPKGGNDHRKDKKAQVASLRSLVRIL